MIKVITAILLVAGIVLAVVGAVSSNTLLAVVGDIIVLVGILVFLILKKRGAPGAG